MDLEQVGLQLGISGLLIYAGVKIALILIANWREAEKERTAALAAGFTALVNKVDTHHTSDIESHRDMSNGIAELKGKLETIEGWQERSDVKPIPQKPKTQTPVRGIRAPRPGTHHDEE